MKPLADLTTTLLAAIPETMPILRHDIGKIHDSVSFMELPESRDSWIKTLQRALMSSELFADKIAYPKILTIWLEFFSIDQQMKQQVPDMTVEQIEKELTELRIILGFLNQQKKKVFDRMYELDNLEQDILNPKG